MFKNRRVRPPHNWGGSRCEVTKKTLNLKVFCSPAGRKITQKHHKQYKQKKEMFTSPLWDVWSAVCWHCTCTWITQWRPENCFQTHVQVGSGEIGPLQVRAAQVGVRQVAAAQIGHLEIDVTQIQSGQISAAEIKTLKSQRVRELKFNLMWWSDDGDWNTVTQPYLTAQLGLRGCRQEKTDKLFAGDGRVVLRRLRVLFRE